MPQLSRFSRISFRLKNVDDENLSKTSNSMSEHWLSAARATKSCSHPAHVPTSLFRWMWKKLNEIVRILFIYIYLCENLLDDWVRVYKWHFLVSAVLCDCVPLWVYVWVRERVHRFTLKGPVVRIRSASVLCSVLSLSHCVPLCVYRLSYRCLRACVLVYRNQFFV